MSIDPARATVTYASMLSCQVCVPHDWDDAQVIAFAEAANPCGTTPGWIIRRAGDLALRGCDEHKAALRTVQSQISVTLAQIALQERRNERIEGEPREPPCMQCGAMTEEEAGQKCLGQAVDDCHGNRLWLDD